MPGPKVHMHAALDFLERYRDRLYAGLGEAMFAEDFQRAFALGAVFPDFHYHAPFRRHVTHDDPDWLQCTACNAPVAVEEARCPSCRGAWWPQSPEGGRDFSKRYRGARGDDAARARAYLAAAELEARLAREGISRVRCDLSPQVPQNFLRWSKVPLEAHCKLDKAFFDGVKALPPARWQAAGIPPLENLGRSHLGFFLGVCHHLALDRALEAVLDPVTTAALEIAAHGASTARLALAARRLREWSGASDEGRLPLRQAAWAIIGRWSDAARIVTRRSYDHDDMTPAKEKFGVDQPAKIVGERLTSYAAAVAGYLGAAPAPDSLSRIVAPAVEVELWRPDPRFPNFGAPRQYDPVPLALIEAAKRPAEPGALERTRAAGDRLIELLERGFPAATEAATDTRFYVGNRVAADFTREFPLVVPPYRIAETFFLRDEIKFAAAGSEANEWEKAFNADGTEKDDPPIDPHWVRSMSSDQFIHYCLYLSGVKPTAAAGIGDPMAQMPRPPWPAKLQQVAGPWLALYRPYSLATLTRPDEAAFGKNHLLVYFRGNEYQLSGIATGERDRIIYMSGDSSASGFSNVCEFRAVHFLKSPDRPNRYRFDSASVGYYLASVGADA